MILYINACIRPGSRTNILAKELISLLNDTVTELFLPELDLKPLSLDLLNKRTSLIESNDYSDPMFDYAKQFAAADTIIIGAPYWDLSFPAILKIYLENIYVTGIVSKYDENGVPVGLCKANKLYYITTAGGPYNSDFSFLYIKEMTTKYFGIPEVELIDAEYLDVDGYDADQIITDAKQKIHFKDDLQKIRSGKGDSLF